MKIQDIQEEGNTNRCGGYKKCDKEFDPTNSQCKKCEEDALKAMTECIENEKT